MSTSPAVSVILLVDSETVDLEPALRSLQAQTFRGFDLIIIDDTASGRAWNLISRLNWPRLRAHRSRPPRGEAAAFSQALQWADGEFVALHRAGGISAPDRLEQQVEAFLRRKNIAAVLSAVDWLDDGGRLLHRFEWPSRHRGILGSLAGCRGPALDSALLYRPALEDAGGLREMLGPAALLDLVWRLAESFKLTAVAEPLYSARFDVSQPLISRRAEVQAYCALAEQLAAEREAYGEEQTDLAAAVAALEARYARQDVLSRRAGRAANLLGWSEELASWGGDSAGQAQALRRRALMTWPFDARAWRQSAPAPAVEAKIEAATETGTDGE